MGSSRFLIIVFILILCSPEGQGASFPSRCKMAVSGLFAQAMTRLSIGLDATPKKANIDTPIPPLGFGVVDTVVVLVVQHGKVLYGLRKGAEGSGTWGILGGKMENKLPGFEESIRETATREVYEESGLAIKKLEWVDTAYVFQAENKRQYRVFIVVAEASGTPRVKEEKIVGFQWKAWRELPEPMFSPNRDWLLERLDYLEPFIVARGKP